MQGRRESGRPARGREEEPARPALPLDASAPPAESDEQVGERCEEIGEREPETVNLVDASGSHSTWTRQVGVWETDPGTRGIHRSLLHDRIFGYVEPLPEWTYETFLSHVVAEDRETVDRKLREAMAAKSEWNLECRIRRHDGEVRWIWVAGGYIASDAGAPPRATGFVQDVTERKTAGTGARGRRERHQDLIETAGEFLWEMDLQARYTYCSPQMETLWGIPPQQMIGKTPFDRMPVQERKAALHAFRGFVRSPRPFRGLESTAFDAKGRPIFIESSGVPFFDEAGTLLGFRGVSRDVTEHKLAEDALREMDRRKDEFLAVLSHELRNPLAPIATALAILGHAAPGGDDARHAQAILERQVHQLTRLVDDLLDVTRIASNKIRLQKARVELNDLARKTVEDHRAAFGDKDVLLHFEASASPIHVEGDGSRLEQCLGNLLQNAVKFTEHGGTVTVSVSADPAAGNAVLRVADTGLGMAPDVLARLFEPFMQADRTLDRTAGGLGLGLSLTKGIVELHGGAISARSAGPGQGSEFRIELPLERAASAQAPELCGPKIVRPRRVLVIEDNRDAAESLRLLLTIAGHEVAVAYDGVAGLRAAQDFRPDVVLCDVGLPLLDGYAVARAIRSDDTFRGTLLVALSGYALAEDLERAAEAGFDRHIAKPATFDKLEEILQGAEGRSDRRPEDGAP